MFQRGRDLLAIEVRTGRRKDVLPCLTDLAEAFAPKGALVVGRSGVPLDELLSRPVLHWLA